MDGTKGKTVSETAKTPARPQAAEPAESVRALAGDYPFTLVLGGLALGVVVGALLPRSAGKKLAQGAVAAATLAGELGLIYGKQALERAGEATGSLDELKDAVSARASTLSRKAAEAAGEALGSAGATAREASDKIGRQAARLRSHLRH